MGAMVYDCDATIEAAVRSLRESGASWVEIERALFDEYQMVLEKRISEQEQD